MTDPLLPQPPYPADTRAKGWRFEIDTEAVKASDTWLRARTGAIRGALLLLWSEAWQQTPCGSLPDDDELMALLIDMPGPTFAKNRVVLMRGWARADDGRLYHETITRRVLAMLVKRAKDAKRTADSRKRQSDPPPAPTGVAPLSRVTPDGPTREFDTKHQAPELSKEKEKPASAARKTGLPPGFGVSARVKAWALEKGHRNLDSNLEALVSYAKRKGAKYVDWDEALMTAIRENWAKADLAAHDPFAGAR